MKKIYSLFKTRFWAVLLITLGIGINAKATVWPIPNGNPDTLEHFIELHQGTYWLPGDTIMLTDASVYGVNNVIDVPKDLMVMGDPELSAKPIIKLEDSGFRAADDSIGVSLKYLEFDGIKTDGGNSNFILGTFWGTGNPYIRSLIIEDVEAYGMKNFILLNTAKSGVVDTLIIDNVICHDIPKGNYFCLELKNNYVKNLSVTNSTFYDMPGFMSSPQDLNDGGLTIDQNIDINHNTFFKIGSNNRALLHVYDVTDETVTLKFFDNVVSTLLDSNDVRPFMINELSGDVQIKYSVINNYDAAPGGVLSSFNLDSNVFKGYVDTMNIYKDYPGFSDSAGRYFTLPVGSPLLTAASDGGAIGDPRWVSDEKPWVPGPHCHLIYNDSVDILKAWFDTIPGGTLLYEKGDTLVLASSSQYTTTKFCYPREDVVLMGDPRLLVKPSLYTIDFGFRLENDTTSLELIGFKVIGWDPADSSSSGNYFLQSRYAGAESIIFRDIESVGFKGFFYLEKGWEYDSIVVDNCIIHDLPNSSYNVFDFRSGKIKYASVTNSTVYGDPRGVFGEFWASDTTTGSGEVPFAQRLICDHNTFYNVVGGSSFLAVHNIKDQSLTATITNNIVSTLFENTNSRPFRYDTYAGSINFENNIFHNFVSSRYNAGSYYGLVQDSLDLYYPGLVTQVNTDTANPYYSDPEAGLFWLADSSSLLAAGTDDGPIGDPRWIPIAGVSINAPAEAVVEGTDVTLTAEVNVSGADKSVTWSVTNGTGTATIIDSTGVLSPLTPGTVTVKATSNYNNAFFDELVITIEEKIFVTGITLEATDKDGKPVDGIYNLAGFLNVTATIIPGSAHDKSIEWSISPESDGEGTLSMTNPVTANLIAVDCGTVYIVASALDGSGVKDSIELTITDQAQIETVTVTSDGDATEITVDNGTLQMSADLAPATNCDVPVTWSVDDESLATISGTGLLTAKSNGTVTVTGKVTTAGKVVTGTMNITLSNQVTSVHNTNVSSIMVMPNPASDFIQIKSEHIAKVVINNIVGAVVLSTEVEPNTSIDISELKAGVYIVNVESAGEYATVRLIKE